MMKKTAIVIALAVLAVSAGANEWLLIIVKTNAVAADRFAITNYITIVTSDTTPESFAGHPEIRLKSNTNDIRTLWCMPSSLVTTQAVVGWAVSNLAAPAKVSVLRASGDPWVTLDAAGFEPAKEGTFP